MTKPGDGEPAGGFTAQAFFQPGDIVTLKGAEDWGTGMVQSVVGPKVTVNFEDAGKRTVNTQAAQLVPVRPDLK